MPELICDACGRHLPERLLLGRPLVGMSMRVCGPRCAERIATNGRIVWEPIERHRLMLPL